MATNTGKIKASDLFDASGLDQVVAQLETIQKKYSDALAEVERKAAELDKTLTKLNGTTEQQKQQAQEAAKTAEALSAQHATLKKEADAVEKSLTQYKNLQQKATKATQQATNAQRAEIASREQHLKLLSKAIGSQETLARAVADDRRELAQLTEQRKALIKTMNASTQVDNASINRLSNLTNRMTGLKTSISQSEIRLKQYTKLNQAAESSGKSLELRLGMLRDAYRNLSDFQKSRPFGQEIKQQIDLIAPKVAEFNKSIKNFHDNVGNYPTGGQGGRFLGMLQVLGGNLLTKAISKLGQLGRAVKEFIADSIEMAAKGEGIYTAFEKLNQPGLLSNLRRETRGTVNDLTLMQSAVRAKNFSIPLNTLGSLLKFARQRAQETGESVDYLTESIVNGLGRKSVLILDNLGISAERIRNEVAKTGNFMEAMTKIVNEELEKQGELMETSGDRAQQAQARWENASLAVGRRFKWLGDLWSQLKSDFAVGLEAMMGELRDAKTVYDDQVSSVAKLETKTTDLINEYTKLTGKSKLTKEEQNRLKTVTDQLAEAIPQAVEYTGKYGDEMVINTDVTKKYVEEQRALLLVMRQHAFMEATEEVKEYSDEIDDLQKKYDRAKNGKMIRIGFNFYWGEDAKKQAAEIQQEITKTTEKLNASQARAGQFASQGDNSTIEGLRAGVEADVQATKDMEAQREAFLAMNKRQLETWLKDEQNAASRYADIARSILEQKSAEDPELTEKQKRAAEKAARDREREADARLRLREQEKTLTLQLEKRAMENENAAIEEGFDKSMDKIVNQAKIRETEIKKNYDSLVKNIEQQRKKAEKAGDTEEVARLDAADDSAFKTYSSAMIDNQKRLEKELTDLGNNYEIKRLEWQKRGLDLQLQTARKGSDEYLDIQLRQIQIEEQIALRRNALLPKADQQDPNAISAGFRGRANQTNATAELEKFDQQQALIMKQWEIDNVLATEQEKFRIRKQAEIDRWKEILRLNKLYGGNMSEQEIKIMQAMITEGEQQVARSGEKKKKYGNLMELLGINLSGKDEEQIKERQAAVMESVNFTLGQLSAVFAAQEQLAQQEIDRYQQRIDAARNVLDSERDAAANGYANNVAQAQKQLAFEKQQQQKAINEKKKAQKAQQAIDMVTQMSSLVTASANIWSSLSSIPIVGPALAAAAIAAMWVSFGAAKIKAAQVTKNQDTDTASYGEGGYEYISGGSHQSGRDVSLGRTQDGRERRVEGGEFLGVINKRGVHKYGSELGAIISSLNAGEFERRYTRAAFSFSRAGITINQNADTARLAADVAAIRRQNERRMLVDQKGRLILMKGNTIRIINS